MLIFANKVWSGFVEKTNGVHIGFFEHILKNVFLTEINITDDINAADILIESHFSGSMLKYKSWKYSIFYSCEGVSHRKLPDNIGEYTFCIGSQKSTTNFISCPLYVAYDYCNPFNYSQKIVKIPNKKVCSLISSFIKESDRYAILEALESKNLKIDYGGKYKNNVGYRVKGEYHEEPTLNFQKDYRIVLAFENACLDDYITEKIINPFRAGTIPVYYGSPKISDYFNPERFIVIDKNNIDDAVDEINRLLHDDLYWLEKVNKPIFTKTTNEIIQETITQMKNILSTRIYHVEIIYNEKKEIERYKTLEPIMKYYNVKPSCAVWGEETRQHELFNKFYSGTNINAASLAINHISIMQRYRDKNKYLLIFESDVLPLYDLNKVDEEIKLSVKEMIANNIDFAFIGKGCFENAFKSPAKLSKISNTLYISNGSRCTESYIVSPKGIANFLDYFEENIDNTCIDFLFNAFFKIKKNSVACWRLPELFQQGTSVGLYKTQLKHSVLSENLLQAMNNAK